MTCRDAAELIELYLVDELTEEQKKALEAHLEQCPACTAELRRAQALAMDLAALNEGVEAPPELMLDVLAKIEDQTPKPSPKRRLSRGWKIGLGAAAAALGLFLISGALFQLISLGESRDFASEQWNGARPEAGYDGGYSSYKTESYGAIAGAGKDSMKAADLVAGEALADSAGRQSIAPGIAPVPQPQPEADGEYGLKIIRTARAELESDRFDEDLAALQALTAEHGGFITSREIYGEALKEGASGYGRSLSLRVRVPEGALDAFLEGALGVGVARSSSIYEEDVTSQYFDADRRLKGYQAQYDRVLEFMQKAESVEDLIAVESELTRLNMQIEALAGKIKYLDSQVGFSTVDLNLREVRLAQPVNTSFGQKLRDALDEGLDAFAQGWRNGLLGFMEALPALVGWLVFLGLLGWLALGIRRRIRRKKQRNTAEK
ncbi:MAG: DUF4349 domain-containing protein [Christensenellaceae bacterium]|jgi:hypothetical protein|nr:DUF4349 domain-containing protein [Christensenellaceae bacterium]